MIKTCIKYCKRHDERKEVKYLDFSKAYLYFIAAVTGDKVYMVECNPADELIEYKEGLPRIKQIKMQSTTVGEIWKRYFKGECGEGRIVFLIGDEYLVAGRSCLKTLQGRLGMPPFSSVESVLTMARYIERAGITELYCVCEKLLDKVYLLRAVFKGEPEIIPWESWDHYFKDNTVMSYGISDTEGLRVRIKLKSITIPDPELGVCLIIVLDDTGHIINSLKGALYLLDDSDAYMVISETELIYQEDLNKMYEAAVIEITAQISEYLRFLSGPGREKYIYSFLSSHIQKLINILGKKSAVRLLEYAQGYERGMREKRDLLLFFLKAARAGVYKDRGLSRFAENGKEIIAL